MKTWWDEFRTSFRKIGELRSIVPSDVDIMALTATCTSVTYDVVTKRLSMQDPVVVALSPSRSNIAYSLQPKIELDELSTNLSKELEDKRLLFPKTGSL